MQVRSAVIPAAGMGTRFLPASKAVPKELLPIGDTPTLQLVIDEALGAGIDHIVVVSSRNKPAVEQYFAPAPELLASLEASGKTALAERVRSIGSDWRATIVYQDEPRGLGHAVGCAAEAVGDEPFAVMLPDELMGSSSLLEEPDELDEVEVGVELDVELDGDELPAVDDSLLPLPELSELPPLLLPPLSDDDELDAAAVRDDDPRLSVL